VGTFHSLTLLVLLKQGKAAGSVQHTLYLTDIQTRQNTGLRNRNNQHRRLPTPAFTVNIKQELTQTGQKHRA